MSWSRRIALAGLAVAAACGFQPALAPDAPARGALGEVLVDAPDTVAEYHLVQRLEERLGRSDSPRYRLGVDVASTTVTTAITRDDIVARRSLVSEVDYVVTDAATGTIVRRGSVRNFTGYSTTSTTVATEITQEEATERLMTLLADRIYYDLVATAADWR